MIVKKKGFTTSLLSCLLALTMTVSCGVRNGTDSTEESADSISSTHTAQNIKSRVEYIYAHVFEEYNKMSDISETMEPVEANFDEQFCSDEWNKLMDKASEACDSELGLFDFDYWIMAQDWSNLSVSDVCVNHIEGDKAQVSLVLHNFSNTKNINLQLVYERGDWYIDNFIDEVNADGGLKSYLYSLIPN